MRKAWIKHVLGLAGLLAIWGGLAVPAGAATSVNLTAQRATLTLPDGTVAPMWSFCGAAVSGGTGASYGGTCVATAAGALPAWTQGPTIVVPAGDALSVTLTNTLPSPTSLTILGQLGGGLGSPVRMPSPKHAGVTASTFPNQGGVSFTPLDGKPQPDRARAFVPEANGLINGVGGSITYTWSNLRPGTYLYQSGSRPSLQVPMGLYGVLVVAAPLGTATAAPVPGTPGVAYLAPVPGSSPPASVALAYDADATFLFSEVDVVQNAAVDAAALSMAAAQSPASANTAFSALEQRTQTGPAIITNPTAQRDDCTTVLCYPAAVNYAPTYFLVNGNAYDPANPAATAQVIADNAAAAARVAAPTGRVVVRFVNAGLKTHIPTLVGVNSTVLAEDGNLQPDVALALSRTAAAPVVSGKVQSALLLPAGKTLDVAIYPAPGAAAGTFADTALPVFDRQLSLSGGGTAFSGLQGFLAIASVTTTTGSTGVVTTSNAASLLPAAQTVAVNPDIFRIPANASTFSGNVLRNDVGVRAVVVDPRGVLPAGLTLNGDGSFTYAPGSVIAGAHTFGYCATATPTLCTTVQLIATSTQGDQVSTASVPLSFTSRVASLLHVSHPGLLSGASSTNNYTLHASGTQAAPSLLPAAGAILPTTPAVCRPAPGTPASATCAAQVLPDGAFTATASVPGTYLLTYYVADVQGTVSLPATATLVFPPGSGVAVSLQDSVTGKSDVVQTFLPGGTAAAPRGQDFRWVIEEDQTYLHDPGNAGFVPPAFQVPITAIALGNGLSVADGVANQVTVTANPAAFGTTFKGFVAGTYIQIQSNVDAFNGVFRINTVSGSQFTYTLWQTPEAGTSLVPTGTLTTQIATTGQSLATNFHRSYMPVVAAGCTGPKSCNDLQTVAGVAGASSPRSWPSEVALDATKRYFISVLPGDAGAPFFAAGALPNGHAMGAAQVTSANMQAGTTAGVPVTVLVPQSPVPPGQLSAFVFEDNNPVSGDVDDGETGLGGFEIVIYDTRGSSGDQAGQITYDLFNQPLTNALANQPGTGTDGNYYDNLCPTTPNGAPAPVGVIYTCLPRLVNGVNVSPYTGMALVKNVIPGRLDVQAHPAAWREGLGEQWLQVSTLEGTPNNDTFVHPGEPAYWQEFGPPGFHSFIGFINPAHIAKANADAVAAATKAGLPVASVTGRVTNLHMDRPPQAQLNNSCQPGTTDASCARAALNYTQCYVALNSQSGNGPAVAWAPCDASTGVFTIANVPADTYELFIWDEWLDQIKAKQLVIVPNTPASNGAVISAGDIPVFNWFTRIQETIYLDINGNGMRDPGEPGLANLVANVRFRDGTFSNRLATDSQGNATHNELFPLFNWYVLENDQTRYKNTGVHIIYDAGGTPDQSNLGLANGGLSANEYFPTLGLINSTEAFALPAARRVPGALYAQGKTERIDPPNWITEGLQGFINQTQLIEWGKQPFQPGENGGISGLIYFASVRAFDDPRLKVQNLSEPGIPRVKVNLYRRVTNPDGSTSDTLVDTTTSSSWDDWATGTTNGVPNLSCPGNAPASAAPPSYVAGKTDPFINYTLGANSDPLTTNQYKCYDGQHAFNQVQPAVYDGYYAFPTGNCDPSACTQVALVNNKTGLPMTNPDHSPMSPVPTLNPGQYVVEVVRPEGYEITKEEDKNILIGDGFITAAPQQFGNLVNLFILPDQATLNDQNPQGQTLFAPPCVGLPHLVPDFLTVVPEAQQTAPFAGQLRNLCDRKLVTVGDQTASNADFQLWTPTPVAGHVSGLMLNDAAAEFDPYSPSFGEKFALPNAPVSVRDFNGVEILRSYTDKWGTFDFLNVSTWEANVPNPSGYAPNMLTYCMNDPGPTPDPAHPGRFRTDPYYNQQYSDFCYNWPILPGVTTYLDTPVLPVSAFASHYAPVDCQYANLTPAILRVDGNWIPTAARLPYTPATPLVLPTSGVGPYVDLARAAATLTITALGDVSVLNPAYAGPTALAGTTYAANRIVRHYGFGAAAGTAGRVQLINNATGNTTSLTVSAANWSDGKLVASVPATLALGSYQLVVTAANGVKTVDSVTVTIDRATANGYRQPWYVAAPPPGTGVGAGNIFGLPHPVQDAIDSVRVLPGDLVILDAGTYPELAVMWKPLRLQGVGAAAVTIQATKYPNSKLADWRNRINLLFGLTPEGNQLTTNGQPNGPVAPAQIDPLPGQEITGGIVRLEPSALSTEEGAGITVLAANNQANPAAAARGCLTTAQLTALAPAVTPTLNLSAATPYGFYPGSSGLPVGQGGPALPATANQPVLPPANARFFSDFACYAARIDGLSVTGSDAGGGIYVNGWAHNLQISNNRVFGNSGPYAGGVRIGQPYLEGQAPNPASGTLSYNQNVAIHNNAITTNGTDEANAAPGSLVGSSGAGGGLAIEAGSDNFKVTSNWICGNFSAGDGGGLGVVGNSTPGLIANNSILFNESYQQTGPSYGGGLAIEGEPATAGTLSTGAGNIVVDSNLIQGNSVRSGSGGGVRLAAINGSEVTQDGAHWRVELTNNIIVNNVAGWAGGGVSLADAVYSTMWGNTIANNDTLGVSGNLMNTQVNGQSTGPSTAVPNPAGVATDPNSAALHTALVALNFGQQVPVVRIVNGRRVTVITTPYVANAPASLFISQPEVMSNNIIYQNRSQFFDAAPANKLLTGVQLCASNQWTDAVAHRCTPLPAQTAVGQCVSGASYWDLGVVGDHGPSNGNAANAASGHALAMDHGVTSVAYTGTGNVANDPLFAKAYCNGGRVNPGTQFEPGSPFQPAFAVNAAATLDESGNYVDIQFGPLSLQDPVNPLNYSGNYHLRGKGGAAYNAGLTPTAAQTALLGTLYRHDVDNDTRPQNGAYDIGADEVPATLTPAALLTAPGGGLATPAANAWNFGTAGIGVTSPAAVFTYSNTGSVPIVLAATPVAIAGTTSTNFAVVAGTGTTCTSGATVDPGSSCVIAVTFTPSAVGVRGPATLTVTAATGGVVSAGDPAYLTGTGVVLPAGVLTPASTSLALTSTPANRTTKTQNLVLTNTGAATLTLANITVNTNNAGRGLFSAAGVANGAVPACVTNGTGTLAVQARCNLAVTYAPTSANNNTGTLTINTVNTPGSTAVTATPVALTGN